MNKPAQPGGVEKSRSPNNRQTCPPCLGIGADRRRMAVQRTGFWTINRVYRTMTTPRGVGRDPDWLASSAQCQKPRAQIAEK
jgi:hypothetical protein